MVMMWCGEDAENAGLEFEGSDIWVGIYRTGK